MEELKEALENMRGKCVDIRTRHRFFGDQNIQMRFEPEIELGYGFCCRGQRIYIRKDELTTYSIKDNDIIIFGDNMEIDIKVAS